MTSVPFDPSFSPQTQPLPVVPISRPYASATVLTPGTPLAAGRGVFVTAKGTVILKLSGGGQVSVTDPTGGMGTRYDDYAVIDADVSGSTDAVVKILY